MKVGHGQQNSCKTSIRPCISCAPIKVLQLLHANGYWHIYTAQATDVITEVSHNKSIQHSSKGEYPTCLHITGLNTRLLQVFQWCTQKNRREPGIQVHMTDVHACARKYAWTRRHTIHNTVYCPRTICTLPVPFQCFVLGDMGHVKLNTRLSSVFLRASLKTGRSLGTRLTCHCSYML